MAATLDIQTGDHVCSFYREAGQKWAMVGPFFRQGLARGEQCLYVAEEHPPAEVQAALQRAGLAVPETEGREPPLVVTAATDYLPAGTFTPGALLARMAQSVRAALDGGYRGLRMAVEMSWALRWTSSLPRLAEYEARLNYCLSQSPVALMCQYNQLRFPEDMLLDVLHTHPLVVGDQTIHRNVYYLPPDVFLRRDRAEQFQCYLANLGGHGAGQPRRPDSVAVPKTLAWGGEVLLEVEPHRPRESDRAATGRWQVHCLGELRVYRPDGSPVVWDTANGATKKIKTLFAYLLERRKTGAPKERLADLLWPSQADVSRALSRLYHTVHCLRLALEPDLTSGHDSRYLLSQGDRYRLALPEESWIDVQSFERLCRRGERLMKVGATEDALACYLAADNLYGGDFLADVPLVYAERVDDDWCWGRRYWLREVYLKLLNYLAEYHLARGSVAEAVDYWQRALAVEPGCETAHRGMMSAYYRAGRHDALVRQYSLCEKLLRRQENRAPAPETTSLYKSLVGALASDR